MAFDEINNGAFDNDPAAETVRQAFSKTNTMLEEVYDEIPLDVLLSGQADLFLKVKADESGYELVAVPGGGDMLSSQNLGDVDDVAQARLNLGLSSAAQSDSGDFATSAQGSKADSALQGLVAGTGVSINVTGNGSPTTPEIVIDAVTVTGMSFDPATGVLTLAVDGGTDITVDLSNYTVLKVGDLLVDKDPSNTNYGAIENDDKVHGWIGDEFVAYKQTASGPEYAVKQSI